MQFLKTIKRCVISGTIIGSTLGHAADHAYLAGPTLNLGKTSHPSTILSLTNNPAAGEVLISEGETMRMGYVANFGFQAEIGEADNFFDEIDRLNDVLDGNFDSETEAIEAAERFNAILPSLADDADITLRSTMYLPMTPFAFRSNLLEGTMSFSLSASIIADAGFLYESVESEVSGTDFTISTDSALYLKGAEIITGSVAYSRELTPPSFIADSQLFGGVQANIHRVSLSKQLLSVENILEDDVNEAARDAIDENTKSSTGVGLDLGVLLVNQNHQMGLSVKNINRPEFDYGEIGTNCESIADPVDATNCNLARQTFADRIDLSETGRMDAQASLEGAIFTKNKKWLMSGSADLNSAYDLIGIKSQYLHLSASYFADSYLAPNFRLSVNKNLSGSKLTTYGLGTTLFGVFNLDIAASTDMVEIEGEKWPRVFSINLGFEEKF